MYMAESSKEGSDTNSKEDSKSSTSEKASKVAEKAFEKVVPEEHHDKIRTSFKDLINGFRHYLNIREGVDIAGTIESVKADVEFKGYNIYILVFSIFIASIGLNVNSTAVIIGAMLISPLMGPIVGVGMAVGISDIKLLYKSLKNLGITVLFSVATSFIYFKISPIHEDSHELLARTTPTILDALVAIFGGLAGIMAASRKVKTNAVPGVAIATALMPPLCTAGYGLANGNFHYFFGAFYLFLLNSVFISLSTIIVVRYVGFPKVDFINPKREKQVKRYIYAFIVAVLVPSGFIFWNVIQESIFNQKASSFIAEHIENDHTSVINSVIEYNSEGGTIKLFLMGERLTDKDIEELEHEMMMVGIENTRLVIRQDKDITSDLKDDISGKLKDEVKSGILEEMFNVNRKELAEKMEVISTLESKLQSLYGDSIPAHVLRKEVHLLCPEIESNYFATVEHKLNGVSDTIPTVFVHWTPKTPDKTKKEQVDKLNQWLPVRLKIDTVRVIEY